MSFLQKVKSALSWLDDHILLLSAVFLLAFIPLYPKIPFWSPIEQYIVRVRMEDFFILGTTILWGIQVLRRKVRWYSPLFWSILAYAIVGAVSTASAIFLTKTVPVAPLHVGKTLLHYFRYLEYFALFFITFAAIKTRRQAKIALATIVFTVIAITVYGYGQRYFYLPVYSTMNREFSKGIQLYLTEFARVQSTFGGHYDMAAYLVVSLPLILAMAFRVRQRLAKLILYTAFWMGTWLLILSASRTPFGAFVGAVGLVILLTAAFTRGWGRKVGFLFTRSVMCFLGIGILFFYFGQDMADRLSHVVDSSPYMSQAIGHLNDARKLVLPDSAIAGLPLSPKQLQAVLPRGAKPGSGISTDDVAAAAAAASSVASKSDQPPSPIKATPKPTPDTTGPAASNRPPDVYEDIPEPVLVATVSATGETILVPKERPRVYSKCALEKELSLCIRQETLWPRAIEGFLTNPFLGSGYATLTKESINQFTEADSTDNNYLRTAGETGALGFITFYGTVLIALVISARQFASTDRFKSAVCIGFFGGSIGLLLNAIYIDVFAASKVALTYWGLTGVVMGLIWVTRQQKEVVTVAPVTATTNTTFPPQPHRGLFGAKRAPLPPPAVVDAESAFVHPHLKKAKLKKSRVKSNKKTTRR